MLERPRERGRAGNGLGGIIEKQKVKAHCETTCS